LTLIETLKRGEIPQALEKAAAAEPLEVEEIARRITTGTWCSR